MVHLNTAFRVLVLCFPFALGALESVQPRKLWFVLIKEMKLPKPPGFTLQNELGSPCLRLVRVLGTGKAIDINAVPGHEHEVV